MRDPRGTDGRVGGVGHPPPSFVRLTVNMELETMQTLQRLAAANRLSLTDGISRAVSIWEFLSYQVAQGHGIALIHPGGTIQKLEMK